MFAQLCCPHLISKYLTLVASLLPLLKIDGMLLVPLGCFYWVLEVDAFQQVECNDLSEIFYLFPRVEGSEKSKTEHMYEYAYQSEYDAIWCRYRERKVTRKTLSTTQCPECRKRKEVCQMQVSLIV